MGLFKWLKQQWDEAGKHSDFWEENLETEDTRSLDEKIAQADSREWTKDEFNAWLDTLEDPVRDAILVNCKKLIAQGIDYMAYLHQIRRQVDADAETMTGIKKFKLSKQINKVIDEAQAYDAAFSAAHGRQKRSWLTTIADLGWQWDEAMKMGEERRFYQEQHERWQKEKKEKGW